MDRRTSAAIDLSSDGEPPTDSCRQQTTNETNKNEAISKFNSNRIDDGCAIDSTQ